jgi:hypothetical protein
VAVDWDWLHDTGYTPLSEPNFPYREYTLVVAGSASTKIIGNQMPNLVFNYVCEFPPVA